jgi:hypothetical protein
LRCLKSGAQSQIYQGLKLILASGAPALGSVKRWSHEPTSQAGLRLNHNTFDPEKANMTSTATQLARIVDSDSGVDAGYQHNPKRVTPLAPLDTSGAVLKWYGVFPEDRPIPAEITTLARQWLTNELEAGGMGFVLLHRCGEEFYFLIACTWRNSNEIWETVYYKNGDAMTNFDLFPRDGVHKPAFCVWELVPVWHEQQTWTRFLTSVRDEAAAQAWLDDRYEGLA